MISKIIKNPTITSIIKKINEIIESLNTNIETLKNSLKTKEEKGICLPISGGTVKGDINVTGKYLLHDQELESGINLLKRNKTYELNDVCFSPKIGSSYHLKCIVAGTTDTTEPILSNELIIDDIIIDGTVTWKVFKYISNEDVYLYVGNNIPEDLHENMIIIDPDETSTVNILEDMTGATETKNGISGFVPGPTAGNQDKFLRGDGTWATPDNTTYEIMTGATLNSAGTKGLVPAPGADKLNAFLKGDGTWDDPTLNQIYKNSIIYEKKQNLVAILTPDKPTDPDVPDVPDLPDEPIDPSNPEKPPGEPVEPEIPLPPIIVSEIQNQALIEIDTTIGNIIILDIQAATGITIKDNINENDGVVTITMILKNGGNYIVTWTNNILWNDGIAPTLTNNGTDIITLIQGNNNTWYGVAATAFA